MVRGEPRDPDLGVGRPRLRGRAGNLNRLVALPGRHRLLAARAAGDDQLPRRRPRRDAPLSCATRVSRSTRRSRSRSSAASAGPSIRRETASSSGSRSRVLVERLEERHVGAVPRDDPAVVLPQAVRDTESDFRQTGVHREAAARIDELSTLRQPQLVIVRPVAARREPADADVHRPVARLVLRQERRSARWRRAPAPCRS